MNYKKTIYKFLRVHQLKRWHNAVNIKKVEGAHLSQYPILDYIKEYPGCMQKDISDRFAFSKAAVSKTIKKLIDCDLVKRERNHRDCRQFDLFITEKGRLHIEQMKQAFNCCNVMMFKDFSKEEMEVFNSFLDRILENLETDYSRDKTTCLLNDEIKKLESEEETDEKDS
ncbi:MAG: MarR family transcriptional regulator [Bacillota bacterium]|jgi:DNA-binding MarR family transcriptional regulator|nr:MarR family transcriptional regulator [Bacillota bacterium]NLL26752.1 MarR family transcriptional regulator [Erysipelotrichia bacterium]